MSCFMPECHSIRPNGSKYKLNHDKNTGPGATFYYCSIHCVYHCISIISHRRLPQPVCGECAWLFFRFPKEATRHPDSDISALNGPDNGMLTPPITPPPRSPNGIFGQVDTATNDPDAMELDEHKYSLPALEETFGNPHEHAHNADGDIKMEDTSDDRTPSPPRIVNVPVRALRNMFIQQHEGIFLFRYTDFRGWPAVQPAAHERQIRHYFQPLVDEEERCGGVDGLLLDARSWCCWAQGFTYLEPELRWILTLIYDLISVVIAKQKAIAMGVSLAAESGIRTDANDDPDKLFWEGRYYLHNLMEVVREMRQTFGIANLTIPRLPWLDGN
ncbi:hypothetical protein F4806DRAFT_507892 [Annulohypoxylon nitens]|nr:hypothetical protein F4806DRAFT_507892 [Annulohypoxylon nitens]